MYKQHIATLLDVFFGVENGVPSYTVPSVFITMISVKMAAEFSTSLVGGFTFSPHSNSISGIIIFLTCSRFILIRIG